MRIIVSHDMTARKTASSSRDVALHGANTATARCRWWLGNPLRVWLYDRVFGDGASNYLLSVTYCQQRGANHSAYRHVLLEFYLIWLILQYNTIFV